MKPWLSETLKLEVKEMFELKYKRVLSDREVIEIAENMTGVFEQILKHKWKQKYAK